MDKTQLAVKEFHEAFGVPVHLTPQCSIHQDRALLRAKLIFEEGLETIQAMGCDLEDGVCHHNSMEFNLVEVADGLADLIYVINGAALEFGIDLEAVFAEVHRSNLSKLWTLREMADYLDGNGERLTFTKIKTPSDENERCYSAKRADGKIVKPKGYSPANIAAVLENQNGY